MQTGGVNIADEEPSDDDFEDADDIQSEEEEDSDDELEQHEDWSVR